MVSMLLIFSLGVYVGSVFHVARTAVGFASQYTGDFPISNVDQSVAWETLPRSKRVRRIESALVFRSVLHIIVVCASIRRFSSAQGVCLKSGPTRRSDAASERACLVRVLRPFLARSSSFRPRFLDTTWFRRRDAIVPLCHSLSLSLFFFSFSSVVFRSCGCRALLFDVDGFGCHGPCFDLTFLPFGAAVSSSQTHARACARRRRCHPVCRHQRRQPTTAPSAPSHSLSISVNLNLCQSLSISLSLNLCQSRSLSISHSLSLPHKIALGQSLSRNHSLTISLSFNLSQSLPHNHSVSFCWNGSPLPFARSWCRPSSIASLSSSFGLPHTLSRSSRSRSFASYRPSLPLCLSHALPVKRTLSLPLEEDRLRHSVPLAPLRSPMPHLRVHRPPSFPLSLASPSRFEVQLHGEPRSLAPLPPCDASSIPAVAPLSSAVAPWWWRARVFFAMASAANAPDWDALLQQSDEIVSGVRALPPPAHLRTCARARATTWLTDTDASRADRRTRISKDRKGHRTARRCNETSQGAKHEAVRTKGCRTMGRRT